LKNDPKFDKTYCNVLAKLRSKHLSVKFGIQLPSSTSSEARVTLTRNSKKMKAAGKRRKK
jgi:hypothetical protein